MQMCGIMERSDGAIGIARVSHKGWVAETPIACGGILYTVYVIECLDGTFYVGETRWPQQRYHEHQLGIRSSFVARHGYKEVIQEYKVISREAAKALEKDLVIKFIKEGKTAAGGPYTSELAVQKLKERYERV